MSADNIALDERTIGASGLLDVDWYLQHHSVVLVGASAALKHYCGSGWKEGCQPNPYFDPAWYARTYANELEPQANPLLHYIERGERENAWPSPHFDPEWYRDVHRLSEHESPLRHFLARRSSGTVSPLPSFDVQAHLAAHPEVIAHGLDPYQHHLSQAARLPELAATATAAALRELPRWKVLRAAMSLPSMVQPEQEVAKLEAVMAAIKLLLPWLPFDPDWYTRTYPDVAEALAEGAFGSAQAHFIEHGFFEGRSSVR